MAKIGQHDRIEFVANRSSAAVGANKIATPWMIAAETEQSSCWWIVSGQNRNAGTAESRMAIEFVAIENRTVVWRHIQFAFWNVHFTSKERVAAAVGQLSVSNLGSPRTWFGKASRVEQTPAGNDDSGAISRPVIICRASI